MTKDQTRAVGGISADEWDTLWGTIDGGLKRRQPQLAGELGLYRCILNNRVVALGTGIDIKDGMTKRLFDFVRTSPSGRNHHAGQLIFAHRNQIVLQVLLTGSGRQAQKIARELKAIMMERHKPAWNLVQGPGPSVRDKVRAELQKSAELAFTDATARTRQTSSEAYAASPA